MKIEYINLKESKYEIPTKVFLPNSKIEKVIMHAMALVEIKKVQPSQI